MTLVVGIIAKNGIVIASDSRMTSEITSNDTIEKIVKLNNNNAIGISGDGTLGIHFLRVISGKLKYDKGIVNLVEQIRKLGKAQFDEYFSHVKPEDRPGLTFLIAGYTKDNEPQIYQLSCKDNFVPRPSSTGFNCIGVPYFADYLLNRFYQSEINIEQAKVLAAFCIMETTTQAHGVGGNIKIASFSPSKSFSELSVSEIKDIESKCDGLHILNRNKLYPEDDSKITPKNK